MHYWAVVFMKKPAACPDSNRDGDASSCFFLFYSVCYETSLNVIMDLTVRYLICVQMKGEREGLSNGQPHNTDVSLKQALQHLLLNDNKISGKFLRPDQP